MLLYIPDICSLMLNHCGTDDQERTNYNSTIYLLDNCGFGLPMVITIGILQSVLLCVKDCVQKLCEFSLELLFIDCYFVYVAKSRTISYF